MTAVALSRSAALTSSRGYTDALSMVPRNISAYSISRCCVSGTARPPTLALGQAEHVGPQEQKATHWIRQTDRPLTVFDLSSAQTGAFRSRVWGRPYIGFRPEADTWHPDRRCKVASALRGLSGCSRGRHGNNDLALCAALFHVCERRSCLIELERAVEGRTQDASVIERRQCLQLPA